MSIDVYFTDRKFNVLGIATTSGTGPINIINDIDDQMAPNSVGRSYTGTLITEPTKSAKLAEMAALGNFVLYKDPRGKYVFATVMDWPDPGYDPQSGELDFVAENGGIDLINETVGAYKATKAMPIADYINLFASDSGFEIGINEISNLTRTLTWDSTDETALTRIESVATQFDNAELDFRFEVSGTAVVKRYIDIYRHIGDDNGQRLEVNTHLNSIKTTGNIYDLYTSVSATGGTPEGSDNPITLAGYSWTDPDGRYELGKDGVLRDTVAVQLWSRALSNDNPNPKDHHIQRTKTYTATTQSALLQSALSGLKEANHASINYVVNIADLPDGVQIGDTLHLVDEAQGLNLSARLLELKDSYANDTHDATLGDYLIEANQIDPALQDVADQLKTLKQTAHWYPWTRYADNDQGTGISSLPLGKAYMAIVWEKTATPSDDPADYAGHWQKVTGADGTDGQPGPAGADGRTSYFHTAWANSIDGKTGFYVGGGANMLTGTSQDTVIDDTANTGTKGFRFRAFSLTQQHKVGDQITVSAEGTLTGRGDLSTYEVILYDANISFARSNPQRLNAGKRSSATLEVANLNGTGDTVLLIYAGNISDTEGKKNVIHHLKAEFGTTATPWSPAPSEAHPVYMGTYTDYTQADSLDPTAYLWSQIKGDTGAQGPQGPQGPAGNDITSYASGTALPTTVAPANSQFWLTNSAGVAIKFYKSTGRAWVEQQISAATINAATFNGLTFNGVVFNGSVYNATFSGIKPDGFYQTVHGTSTLKNGALVTDVYFDSNNAHATHIELNQWGFVSESFNGDQKVAEVGVEQGSLTAGAYYQPTENSSKQWITGSISAQQLLQIQLRGTQVWSGVSLMGWSGNAQSVSLSRPITDSSVGYLLVWEEYDMSKQAVTGTGFRTTLLPKEAVVQHPGTGWPLSIMTYGNTNASKYIYPALGVIGGSTMNGDGDRGQVVLVAVYLV